jgi:hypothetical protein
VNTTHQKQAKIIKADRNEIAANSELLLLRFGFQKASREYRKFVHGVILLVLELADRVVAQLAE